MFAQLSGSDSDSLLGTVRTGDVFMREGQETAGGPRQPALEGAPPDLPRASRPIPTPSSRIPPPG